MLHWKEFSAWITVDGKEATEYHVQTSEDQKTVTCWIASEVGKKFSVHWTNAPYDHDIGGSIYMDGNFCLGKIVFRDSMRTMDAKGISDGLTMKPFMFSSLELTDDTVLDSSVHQDLGIIKLAISPIRVGVQVADDMIRKAPSLSPLKVHERSKKAITQQIMVGEAQILAQPISFHDSERAGPDIVTFSFKYRPIDFLRAIGVAPRSLSLTGNFSPELQRTPTLCDDSSDDADVRELQMLRERLNKLEAKVASKRPMKQEDADLDVGPPNKKIKKDGGRPFIHGEIIDLT